MQDKMKWEGLDEINKTLKRLPNLKTQNNTLVSAFRSAAKPTLLSLENNAPYNSGDLSRSHGFVRGKGNIIDYGKIGPLKSKGGFTGLWNEEGTDERKTRNGWNTGKVTSMKYFTKSWNANITIMQTILTTRITKIVNSYYKKLHKQQ